MRPGPLRLLLENRTERRVLPAVDRRRRVAPPAGAAPPVPGRQAPLTSQTFRHLPTDTLDLISGSRCQPAFLFTDLKGSTELYDRVGDLPRRPSGAFRVVNGLPPPKPRRRHQTIGDARWRPSDPDRAVAAALHARAMRALSADHGRGPAAQDRHPRGRASVVSTTSRISLDRPSTSPLASGSVDPAIFATGSVVDHPGSADLLSAAVSSGTAAAHRGIPEGRGLQILIRRTG